MTCSSNRKQLLVAPVLMSVLLSISAYGQEFAGGAGTPEDPYQIATADQLVAIGSNPFLLYRDYVLVADVNLAGYTFSHAVIAPEGAWLSFMGSFCGAGHRIVNLTIAGEPGSSVVGLFGQIDQGARVWELGLENANVTGTSSTGILAGRNSGTISSCYSAGSVTGSDYVGGLVGSHGGGIISNSYSTAAVTGHDHVGGLVGYRGDFWNRNPIGNWAPIWNCYAVGPVAGDPDAQRVGGLVGFQPSGSTEDSATASYFLRPEDGGGPDNGLGQPSSTTALRQQGTFVGWDFVGTDQHGTDDMWFMPAASYPVLSWQLHVHGQTLEEATTFLTDAGFTVSAEPAEDYHRTIPVGRVITTDPYEYAPVGSTVGIIVSRGPCDWSEVPGSGTSADPYLIATAGVLEALSDNYTTWEACVKLTDDIDMGGRQYAGAVISYSSYVSRDFVGTFDGDNHTISHLNVSLFDTFSSEVRNLRIENADIQAGKSYVGILAGENYGTIRNCRVTGRVFVHPYNSGGFDFQSSAGGLVGTNHGTIAACQATVEVTGQENVGGLVGGNGGAITDSHAEGSVTGHEGCRNVGGLVGQNGPWYSPFRYNRGTVLRCWATSDVTTGTYAAEGAIGGLIGENQGVVTLCYASGAVYAKYSYGGMKGTGTGGLIGTNGGDVTNCYATGFVSGSPDENVGGLVGCNSSSGYAESGGRVRDCYATGEVVTWGLPDPNWPVYAAPLIGRDYWFGSVRSGYFLDPNDNGSLNKRWGIALTDAAMRSQASFSDWDFYGNDEDGPDDPWFMPADGYPILSWQTTETGLTRVPEMFGMSQEEARTCLDSAGFLPGDANQTDYHRTISAGHVLLTLPHRYAPIGSAVGLVLSQGPYDWSDNSGAGTADDPYLIDSAGQLESLSDHSELWAAHFTLADDIDMSPRSYGTALIAPGRNGPPFTGVLDGRGHRISNLVLNPSSGSHLTIDNLGLLGSLSPTAEVRDLTLQNASVVCDLVYAPDHIGLLAGTAEGTISNCHITGEILAPYRSIIGGLVGESKNAILYRCSATVSIDAGGNLGGLVGVNQGSVDDCFARTAILGMDSLGALVGQNTGNVRNCYSSGSITGNKDVGGLVGSNLAIPASPGGRGDSGGGSMGYIRNCRTTALVRSTTVSQPLGGLVAQSPPENIVASYYLVPQEDTRADNGLGEPLTQEQMQDRLSFPGWDFYGGSEDGNEDHWFMPDGQPPVLSWQTETSGLRVLPDLSGLTVEQAREQVEKLGLTFGDIVDWDYFPVPAERVGLAVGQGSIEYVPLGSEIDIIMSLGPYDWEVMNPGVGSAEAPYEIASAGQLVSLLSSPGLCDAHFVLTEDIDMAGRAYPDAMIQQYVPFFNGTFDGCGYVIRNLTISVKGYSGPLGLFGGIDTDAHVTNLGLDNVRITKSASRVGALAGENRGHVTNCYSAGTISGYNMVGGLIGSNLGEIADCYSSGSVSGAAQVGGLLAVNGTFGGRGGAGASGNVKNCYSTATVQGTSLIGGLLGDNLAGDIIQSYYLSPPAIAEADNHLGEPLTDDQMRDSGNFLNWDFVGETANGAEAVWTLCAGKDYPRLWWENLNCPGE